MEIKPKHIPMKMTFFRPILSLHAPAHWKKGVPNNMAMAKMAKLVNSSTFMARCKKYKVTNWEVCMIVLCAALPPKMSMSINFTFFQELSDSLTGDLERLPEAFISKYTGVSSILRRARKEKNTKKTLLRNGSRHPQLAKSSGLIND